MVRYWSFAFPTCNNGHVTFPEGWKTPQGEFGDKDPSGGDSQAHKKAVKYGRKFIRRDLQRSDCPLKLIIKPNADCGDDDVIIYSNHTCVGLGLHFGADISTSARRRTHSAPGDSVSSEKPGDTGPAVLAAAASLALRPSQAEKTQAK